MDSVAPRQYMCVFKIVLVLFLYVDMHIQAMHRGGGLAPMYSTKAAH